jgi:hypothetical protein
MNKTSSLFFTSSASRNAFLIMKAKVINIIAIQEP